MYYEYEDGKSDYLGQSTDKTEIVEKVSYIALQAFFFSILLTDVPLRQRNYILII
jgi:YidC/Oxa1 family membrane protein insertase